MKKIYEAHAFPLTQDCNTEEEARALVERNGDGYVVTFVQDYDGRCRSTGMDRYDGNVWVGVDIHGGCF
jgi:hypothetical protein